MPHILGRSTGAAFAAVLSLALAGSLHAATLHDEIADGDFPNTFYTPASGNITPAPFNLGTLPTGINDVTGRSVQSTENSPTTDRDGIYFTVPVGYELTQLILDYNERTRLRLFTYNGSNPTGPVAGFPYGPMTDDVILTKPASPTSIDLIASQRGGLALPAGGYALLLWNAEITFAPTTLNYTVTFNVVPEPAAVGLLACGAAMIFRRRR